VELRRERRWKFVLGEGQREEGGGREQRGEVNREGGREVIGGGNREGDSNWEGEREAVGREEGRR